MSAVSVPSPVQSDVTSEHMLGIVEHELSQLRLVVEEIRAVVGAEEFDVPNHLLASYIGNLLQRAATVSGRES